MATIQIKRGPQSAVTNLVLAPGEMAVALDTGNVYIGTSTGNVHLNPAGGTADVATKLQTPRDFSAAGDATAPAVSFDGTQNVQLQLTLASISGLQAGTYTKVTVDAKGRVTTGSTLTIEDLPSIPSSKVTGLGTAAAVDTGTGQGNVPVVQADGKLLATLIPDLSGTYVPVGTTINGKPLSVNVQLTAGDVGAIPTTQKGAASGVAELDSTGKVPASQLPSYVDDVVECYVVGSTPYAADWLSLKESGAALTPESGKIYLVISEGEYQNREYRWGGTQYAQISASLALGETASTAYRGDRGKAAYDHSQITKGNPHGTTAAQVGAAPSTHPSVVGNASTLGHVKPTTEFTVGADGALSLNTVDGGTFA